MAKKNANVESNVIKITAEDVSQISMEVVRKGKDVNHNSGRQRILQVLKASEIPLSPSEVNVFIEKFFGEKIKWISSHVDYFKKHGQVIAVGNGKYRLAEKMLDKVADINVG